MYSNHCTGSFRLTQGHHWDVLLVAPGINCKMEQPKQKVSTASLTPGRIQVSVRTPKLELSVPKRHHSLRKSWYAALNSSTFSSLQGNVITGMIRELQLAFLFQLPCIVAAIFPFPTISALSVCHPFSMSSLTITAACLERGLLQ